MSSSSGEAPPQEQLGDFRLLREVGRGGTAVVYEAEQISLGRRVALKVLPFAAVVDPKQLQRFQNEAYAAAQLHHPHIVRVYAVGVERGVHYHAMQLIEGESVAAVIREMRNRSPGREPKTPITSRGSNRDPAYVRMAVALGVQAAQALDHAHELGVVHRDVKPANLLVDGAGELWVTDFGLARTGRDGNLTISGELVGTYRYMSPEQTHAKRLPLDHRTDVYSLGATLYELLTLEPAFPGDDPHVVLRDIVQQEPIPPRRHNPALPVDLETIVLKAMSKDPSSRYATAQEMAEDLDRCLRDQPVRARRPSLAARGRRWARRHRGLVAAAFVVLAVTILALLADKIRVGREQRNTVAALDQARSNLLLARGAIEKFLVEIGVSNMADLPLPEPARQRLLESALGFLERELDDRRSLDTRVTILHSLHRYDDALVLLDAMLAREPSDVWALMHRGHMLWHGPRDDAALAALDRAIELDPGCAEAVSYRGCVLAELGRPADALAAHDRAIELDPDVAAFHNYRGNDLANLGRREEALAAYARASELDPDLPNAHSGRGRVLLELGRREEALAAYEQSIRIDSTFAWGHSGRGAALQALRRLDEALEAHDRAIAMDPDDARAFVNRGVTLRELGRWEDAIRDLREAVRLQPGLADAHDALGVALLTRGQSEEGLRELAEVLRLRPASPYVRLNLGWYHLSRREWDDAAREYLEAIKIQPDLKPALLNLAAAYAGGGKAGLAVENYRKVLDMDRNHAEAWGGLGNVRRTQGDFAGALEAYTELARIRPTYAVAHFCRGEMLARLGRHEEAIEAFRVTLQRDKSCAPAHTAIAASLLSLDDPEGAIEAASDALRMRPDDALALYQRGRALGATGELEREIEDLREAVRLRPDFYEAWISLGSACNDTGETDDAIEALDEALRIKPDAPEVRLNLGMAWNDRQEPDRALAEFRAAIALLARVDAPEFEAQSERDAHDVKNLARARIGLARILRSRKEYGTAAEHYEQALQKDATLADDLGSSHRFDAACTAVQASVSGVADPAAWRRRALQWLRADLQAREKAGLVKSLERWPTHADLASVRDDTAGLTEVERTEWTRLWQEVAACLARGR